MGQGQALLFACCFNAIPEQACDRHWAHAAGNRSYCTSYLRCIRERDVADYPLCSIIGDNAIDADINDYTSGLNPTASNHFGTAYCRY